MTRTILLLLISITSLSAQLGFRDRGIVVPDGLIGYYTLDASDNRGLQAVDRSGTGNTGFITNTCVQSNGVISGALAFNGANTAVLFTNGAIFGTGSNKTFSIAYWMYPKGVSQYDNCFKTGSSISGKAFIIGLYSTSQYYVDTWFGAYTPNGPVPLNTWTHVALTADGTNFTLYCNSVLTNVTAKNPDFTSQATAIGQGVSTGFPRPFNGVLDDVRLYNRALTAAEVLSIYRARH